MRKRPKENPALKHGGYSALTLLPGEDRFAFQKLRRELIEELKPRGRLEKEIVMDIARLVWRKRNLGKYELTQAIRILADMLLTSCNVLGERADTERPRLVPTGWRRSWQSTVRRARTVMTRRKNG